MRILSIVLLLLCVGCDDGSQQATPATQPSLHKIEQRQRWSESRMRGIYTSIQLYEASFAKFPDSLDDLKEVDQPDREGVSHFGEDHVNPITGQRPGYLYIKPSSKRMHEIRDAYRTPLLIELGADGKPDKDGAILWADGEVERKRRQALPAGIH